jgi:photosystem II stability/assembly factor-like uncharacterized protein
MAKTGIVYVGGDQGLFLLSDPANIGRWRKIGHEFVDKQIVAILAQNALEVSVALGSDGIWASQDGGQAWQPRSMVATMFLLAHPAAPTSLYAASTNGIRRSDDAGLSWDTLDTPGLPKQTLQSFLVDPHSAGRLLVGYAQAGLFASNDGAKRWFAVGAGLPSGLRSVAVSPNRANRLFALAGTGLWTSGESGLWVGSAPLALATSTALGVLGGANEAVLVGYGDQHNPYGIARSIDDGATWELSQVDEPLQAPLNLIHTAHYHIDTAWAGTADGRLLLSSDRGRTWKTIARDLGSIRAIEATRLA